VEAVKSQFNNRVVQAVINVAATKLMVFQPELAPSTLMLLTVSSTVNNLDDLISHHTNGTLKISNVRSRSPRSASISCHTPRARGSCRQGRGSWHSRR
jgi:hypothetical protein